MSFRKTIACKMVVLGDQGVGKTCLLLRHVEKEYSTFVSPTIGASYFSCLVTSQNISVKLQIWDTAGQERFKAMAPMFYRSANVALLVYDITRLETFNNIKKWIVELSKNADNIVVCIVGNKTDLKNQRKVTKEEAIKYANSIGALYHECSTLQDEGVEKIFVNTAEEYVKAMGEMLTVTDEVPFVASTNLLATDVGRIVVLNENYTNIEHAEPVGHRCC